MKIGVVTNDISQNYEEVCIVLNNAGIHYAELQRIYGKPVECLTDEEALKVKALSDQYNIQVCALANHAFEKLNVFETQVGDEAYTREMMLMERAIDIAEIIHCPVVRPMPCAKQLVTFGYHGADKYMAHENEGWERLLELFRPLDELANKRGIDMMVETGFGNMISSAFLAEKFIRELNSKRMSVLWDPANALYYNEIPYPDGYNHVKNIVRHIHMKDIIFNGVESTADVKPIGRGTMAGYFDRIREALLRDGYNGLICYENILRPDAKNFIDGFLEDIQKLKDIFESDEIVH